MAAEPMAIQIQARQPAGCLSCGIAYLRECVRWVSVLEACATVGNVGQSVVSQRIRVRRARYNAPTGVDSSNVLESALPPGTDGMLTLTADAYDVSTDVIVNRDVPVDLGGQVLMPNSLTVTPGNTLTLITDGGVWTLGGTRNLGDQCVIKAAVATDVIDYMTGNNSVVRFVNTSPAGGFTDVCVHAPMPDAAGIAFPVPTRVRCCSWRPDDVGHRECHGRARA